ncbi:MAG TPA: hypothetical protein VHV51_21385 [Polyangiaceae bacterium]|nr:hypothetical protein [Polyangiaceae bacterium]
MSAINKQNLDRVVAENCLKLFGDYKLEIVAGEPGKSLSAQQFLLCGIIGFTSRQLRGALVLATTREPLELTNPAASQSHRDWICELANQLLGRVKNQMLRRGVEIFASTPIALKGEHLSPILQQRLIAELFIAGGGIVCVWMDCEFDPGFELPESAVFEAAPVSEGETLLF